MISLLFAVAAWAAAAYVGWWLLAVVAVAWGVALRKRKWPALFVGTVVAALGVVRLGWLALAGAPVPDAGILLADVTGLPALAIWGLALLVPAAVAACGATLGAALGRRVMFG